MPEHPSSTPRSLIELLFEEADAGLCLVAPDGTVVRANAGWLRSTGFRAEQVIGAPILDLFPDARDMVLAMHARARTGHRVEVPRHAQVANGRETWWEGSISPVTMEGGTGLLVKAREVNPGADEQPAAHRASSGEVTDRKRQQAALRASEERFRLLADAMPQIVCVLAPDGDVEYVNGTWTAFSGLDSDSTARAGWDHIVHPEDVSAARECRRAALKRLEPQDVELRYRAADGTYRWFLSRLVPMVEGRRVARFIGAAMDIDARKRAEQALREANAKLVEADRRKDEFLGMLSHELRNPLAPIRNSTYILRHAEPGSEQARRAQGVIQRQTEHLTRLVDDLLDVTRIVRGKIAVRRSRVDLRDVVGRAADDFQWMMRDHGVRFEVAVPDEPLWADVDETRIAQVVGNLLTNAGKFTRHGDGVTLSLAVIEGAAEIRVRDTGAGIEPDLLSRVFEPFVQGTGTLARTEGGLGLGLALVKGITELHGGTVRADSAGKGRGAEFTVRIPLAAAVETATLPRGPVGRKNGGLRVLVVDDNVDAAESLADFIRMLGHTADVAYDGPAAIEKTRTNRPDVLLCDLGLPGMTGFEVARTLRARAAEPIQLVAVSGYAQPEDVKRAIEAGFDAHIAKPCDPEKIERLLG